MLCIEIMFKEVVLYHCTRSTSLGPDNQDNGVIHLLFHTRDEMLPLSRSNTLNGTTT